VSGTEAGRDFIPYERMVNPAIGSTPIAELCIDRVNVTADELVRVLFAHPAALGEILPPHVARRG